VSASAHATPDCGLEEWIAFTQDRKMNHSEMLRYYGLLSLIPAGVHTVLDAGCGKGYMSYLMSRKGYQVHAVDINTEYLALFAPRCATYGITQAREDLFTYTPRTPFDLVLSQEVLEHIPNYADALKRLAGCVGPGGWGLFCVPYKERLEGKMITDPVTGRRVHKNGHLHSFDPEGFSRTLDESGFRVVKMQLFTNKRLLNWMGNKKRVLSRFWTDFDRFMNHFFPHRATYMAFLVQRR
jgi:2-polyprenyl-3-methyl-5-hydroxy-6-metoxy-1,4-benzoquinol methylase